MRACLAARSGFVAHQLLGVGDAAWVEGYDVRELGVVELHQAGFVEPVDSSADERLDLHGAVGLHLRGHCGEAAASAAQSAALCGICRLPRGLCFGL